MLSSRISTIAMLSITACDFVGAEQSSAAPRSFECPPGCICVCEEPTSTGGTSNGSSTGASDPTQSNSAGTEGPGIVDLGPGTETCGAQTFPSPTAPCPPIETGVVSFCPAGFPCRDVRFTSVESATGLGPLILGWAGTFNDPDTLLAGDYAFGLMEAMAEAEGGMMALPFPDPEAVARPDTPMPWWIVCGTINPTQCDRLDDFALADEIVACSIEQGLIDPDRISSIGGSAGGIMTTHLIDRAPWLAGAVSWSGGVSAPHRPTIPPADSSVSVMAIHGGATDQYCGPGVMSCYDFVEPTEALAADLTADGRWLLLCDHNTGHHNAMGNQAVEFIAQAHRSGHAWDGWIPGMTGDWMIDNYCYSSGDPSPWQ